MTDLHFTKMHGLGNDFLVAAPPTPQWPDADTVRRLADRRTGVGFDQLLLVERPRNAGSHAAYRIFNADGSTAGQCGNGARCIVRWLAVHRGLAGTIVLDSPAGTLSGRVLDDGDVEVDMGAPRFAPADIPLRASAESAVYTLDAAGREVRFAALSMGNPHAVIEIDSVATAPVGILGPALEQHPDFPERVNVGFMQVVSPGEIRLRVHERGVGETRACGTGACAAAVTGLRAGRLSGNVAVALPGGTLAVRWAGPGQPVWMSGEAVLVYEGHLRL